MKQITSKEKNLLRWDKWSVNYIRLHDFPEYQYTSTNIIPSQAVGEYIWCCPLWRKLWDDRHCLLPKPENPINCSVWLCQVSCLWAATPVSWSNIWGNQWLPTSNQQTEKHNYYLRHEKFMIAHPKTTGAEEFVVNEPPRIVSKCNKSDT